MKGINQRIIRGKYGKLLFAVLAIFVFVAFFATGNVLRSRRHSDAEAIIDGSRVEEDSELTYYLNVKYDGVDRNGVESSDSTTAEVRSGVITVTDKIPDGLIFQQFVETTSGSIGAVERSDNTTACAGYVYDDTGDTTGWNSGNTEFVYHGLHYDAATRTVSFKVKNLKAGCVLAAGIVTKTPTLPTGVTRMDFYNTAGYLEGDLSGFSNTAHVYIGADTATMYDVVYQYTGTVPANAPALPNKAQYLENATVGVMQDAELDGYTFSGWVTSDATVTNGSFTMPARTVTFSGNFTAKAKYNVSYQMSGDVPEGYIAPKTHEYGAGDVVEVDSTEVGTVIDGYRFLGWNSTDVTISDGMFDMPARNVVITGSFERISYTVSYEYMGSVIPTGSDAVLPAEEVHYPGDAVTTAAQPSLNGYRFLGWYKSDSFEMPEEDVVIKGEWSAVSGIFRPTITQTIIDEQEKYRKGDTVEFEITIANPESFTISNVNVGLELEGAEYVTNSGYILRTSQLAEIENIPAGGSVKLYAKYRVPINEETTIDNVATILSATASNGYLMDTSDDALATYKSKTSFDIKSWDDIPPFTGVIFANLLPFAILIALCAIGGIGIVLKKRKI